MKTSLKEREDIAFQKEARLSPVCLGCGGEKDCGEGACIVCWNCWRHPVMPFKYFAGTLKDWIAGLQVRKEQFTK